MKFSATLSLSVAIMALSTSASAQKPPIGGAGTTQAPAKVVTLQLVEVGAQGKKNPTGPAQPTTASTWRLDPSGTVFSGPVRICLKYTSGQTATQVANQLTAAIRGMLREIKDSSGKASYTIPSGNPEDDKAASQMCYTLRAG